MLSPRPLVLHLVAVCSLLGLVSKPAAAQVQGRPFLDLYCDSYDACRAQFRGAAAEFGREIPGFRQWSAALPGDGDDLTVDFAFFPAAQPGSERLLVLSSGVHGIEGYTGSTLQTVFLASELRSTLASGVNVLLVHGINAYGFKHRTRYTESRVDLNRNWFVADAFPTDIPDDDYDQFRSLFEPTGPARFGKADFAWFVTSKLVPRLGSIRSGALTKAAGQGQFRFPEGLEFGGDKPEPHRDIIVANLGPYLDKYPKVLLFDLHTGLGRRAMQLLPNPTGDAGQASRRQGIFEVAGLHQEETGGADFYSSFGDFSDFVCGLARVRAPDGACTNMLLEYGTLIEDYWQEWPLRLGSAKASIEEAFTLYLSIRENQAHYYGAASAAEEALLRRQVDDLFYPKDQAWRVMVLAESLTYWPKFIANFSQL